MRRFNINMYAENGPYVSDMNPVLVAVEENDVELLKHLISLGAEMKFTRIDYDTLLTFAIRKKCSIDMIKFLVEECKLNVNAKIRDVCAGYEIQYFKDVSLTLAAKNNDLELVKYLVEHKADPNCLNIEARYGYHGEESIEEEFGSEAEFDCEDEEEYVVMYPIQHAVANNNLQMVLFLLDHQANPEPPSKYKYSPIQIAMMKNNSSIVDLFKQKGCDYNKKNFEYKLFEDKNVKALERLFKGGLDINKETSVVVNGTRYGQTLLLHACEIGAFDVMKFLIDHGAKISSYCFPFAAYGEELDALKYLVEKGADINADSPYGNAYQISILKLDGYIQKYLDSIGCKKSAPTKELKKFYKKLEIEETKEFAIHLKHSIPMRPYY